MLSVLIWWLALQVIGLLCLPITLKLLRFLPDRGFGFARQVGLLLTGYLFWLLVTLGILQNTAASIVAVLVLLGAVSASLWAREGRALWDALKARRMIVWATEAVFLLAFLAFAWFRAFNPEIANTEKPMEFAFINGILRSRTFPPNDPWLSGYAISYYYFGYVLVALLTRLTGVLSDVSFNLTVVMLFALTVGGAFSLAYNLVQAFLDRRAEVAKVAQATISQVSILAGLVGAMLVAVIGNLEGVFEWIRARGLGSEALWRWLDVKNLQATPPSSTWYPDDLWWWWRASRVVHDRDALGNSMEVIDEFPFFSFLLGDNHPHVLALPFVLLALAIAFNVLLGARSVPGPRAALSESRGFWARMQRGLQTLWVGGPFDLLLWGLLVGALGFLNTWDYPIYLGLLVVAYAIRRRLEYARFNGQWLGDVIQAGLVLLIIGLVCYAPFYLGFRSQAGGFGLVTVKTRLTQYLLMFGLFIYLGISLLVAQGLRYRRLAPAERKLPFLAQLVAGLALVLAVFCALQGWWTVCVVLSLAGFTAALLLWGVQPVEESAGPRLRLDPSSLMALLMLLAGLLLSVSVEFVFLRDTFNSRMNTVFKFYYQAWVLMALASAYGLFYILYSLRRAHPVARAGAALWGLGALILVMAGLTYPVMASVSKANGFRGTPTLNGSRYVEQYRPEEYGAIQWLRTHAVPDAVLLEATGPQYSEYNWVSASTGIPTVLGWGGHELQWRGNYDEPGRREPDIAALYQGLDVQQTATLLDKYGIDYVFVGPREREKYQLSQPMIDKFDRLMQRVYENGNVILFGYVP